MEVTGIILAGGHSKRMKAEKGLVEFNDKPLIQYSIDVLRDLADHILISSNTRAYDQFGFPVVPDEFKDIGPVGGIYTCLKASKTSHNIIISCDTPFISRELLSFLLNNSHNTLVTVPWFGNDRYEPLTAYYHKDFIKELLRFIKQKNYKLPDIFREVEVNKLPIKEIPEIYQEMLFYNVNSPEDISRLTR